MSYGVAAHPNHGTYSFSNNFGETLMQRIFNLSVVFMFLLFTSECYGAFRALLVGIDYGNSKSNIPRLYGSVNDVREMHTLMTKTLGIPEASIRMLLEEQATREAILKTFRKWLIDGTKAGDVVYFQYSGHGIQIPDTTGSQQLDPLKADQSGQQKLAEAFVPYDTQMNTGSTTIENLIPDSEFHRMLDQLAGRDVTLFLDNCYSAGVTRDYSLNRAVTRNLQIPWKTGETRLSFTESSGSSGERAMAERVTRQMPRTGKMDATWNPEFTLFAAAKYFQSAYEHPLDNGHNGAFTFPVLKLIQANPTVRYTNRQVIEYARDFVHNVAGISETLQEPMFYGPIDGSEKPFVLLAQANPGIQTPGGGGAGPSLQPAPVPVADKTGVLVSGTDGSIKSSIASALQQSDFARFKTEHPDVIVEIQANSVFIHSAAGKRLKTIAIVSSTRVEDIAASVLQSLESIHIVRELAALENPAAPFAVELWIDEPGKTVFRASDRVTLYYKVNGLPKGKKAHLTLLNVGPDGTVSILYPQKKDFVSGAMSAYSGLYFNAEVESGKVFSIPRKSAALKPGQNVAMDLRIRLGAGQEYFKAIITSEPIDWGSLNLGEFRSAFKGPSGRNFAAVAVESVGKSVDWSSASLRVEVTP
jgi:Caspase domain